MCLRKLLKKRPEHPPSHRERPIRAATLLIGRNRVSIGDKQPAPASPSRQQTRVLLLYFESTLLYVGCMKEVETNLFGGKFSFRASCKVNVLNMDGEFFVH